MARVAVVIPAYRPNEALPAVVSGVLAADADRLIDPVVVIDDGSGEPSRAVFDRLRGQDRTVVIARERNGGKGAALKMGFAYVLERAAGCAGVVTADADGQHAPADILRVARALAGSPDRVILGVRMFDDGVPLRNRLGNVVTRQIVRLVTGVLLQDTQTGLRGWPLRCCREALRLPADRYEFELQALLTAIHAPIEQMPIATIYEDGNRSSHFRPVGDSLRIYRVLALHALRRIKG
jgi:glycosyltransferase involved in cell wall biosynthesis